MVRSVLKAWLLLGLTAGSADVAFRWPDAMAAALADVVLGCVAIALFSAAFRAVQSQRPSARHRDAEAARMLDHHLRR